MASRFHHGKPVVSGRFPADPRPPAPGSEPPGPGARAGPGRAPLRCGGPRAGAAPGDEDQMELEMNFWDMCVRVCVCVCREGEREGYRYVCVCVYLISLYKYIHT